MFIYLFLRCPIRTPHFHPAHLKSLFRPFSSLGGFFPTGPSAVGKKSSAYGAMRSCSMPPKHSHPGGEVCKESPVCIRATPVRPSLPGSTLSRLLFLCAVFPQFLRSFSAVASMAQALEITRISKQRPIALMIPDVVNIRCPGSYAPSCAITAPWLPQELLWPQLIAPFVCAVHPAPTLGHITAIISALWSMALAPPVLCQCRASWVSAGPERL